MQKPLDLLRRTMHDPIAISGYFTKLQNIIMEKSKLDGDIWNVEKTGFRISVEYGTNNWNVSL